MSTTITTRVSEDVEKDIAFFSKEEHTDRSTLVRTLLSTALTERKITYALKKYQEKEVTIGKAAELAGVPLRRMLQIAADRGIPFQYTTDDLLKDFQAAQ